MSLNSGKDRQNNEHQGFATSFPQLAIRRLYSHIIRVIENRNSLYSFYRLNSKSTL